MTRFLGLLVAYACFGAAFVELCLFFYSVGVWNEPGRVTVPGSGQLLELQGAPGDTVRLTLPVPVVLDADYRELSAELWGGTTATYSELVPLNAAVDTSASDSPAVRGRLVVPELPVGTDAMGRLFGVVRAPNGEVHSTLNAPLTLRVLGHGEGAASGTRDMQFHRFRLVVWNSLAVAVAGLLFALASAVGAWEMVTGEQEDAV